MPVFNHSRQAAEILLPQYYPGVPKPADPRERIGKIYGQGTYNKYHSGLVQASRWARKHYRCRLLQLTAGQCEEYLEFRRLNVADKQLNQDRLGLEMMDHIEHGSLVKLDAIIPRGEKATESRIYTSNEKSAIFEYQRIMDGEAYAFSSEVAEDNGLRALELVTLRRLEDLDPDDPHDRAILDKMDRREWNDERFDGRPGVPYVTVGKNGLPRIVMISKNHSERLENEFRLPVMEVYFDRGNPYWRQYSLPGGQDWSRSFSRASFAVLGKSHGGHAMRHDFAERRYEHHRRRHLDPDPDKNERLAREFSAQELGHFDPRSTDDYLRSP